MTEIYTREQAKASDRELARLSMEQYLAEQALRDRRTSLHFAAGDSRKGYGYRSSWKLTLDEVIAKAHALAAEDKTYVGKQAEKALADLEKAEQALYEAKQAVAQQAQEWYNHGMWERYQVVPGGHIHNNEGCFTLRATTDVRWMPDLSGDPVDVAVATYGEALCSHCYPDAPSSWKQQIKLTQLNAEGMPLTKAEREAVQAEKAAEKAAKAKAKSDAEVLDPHTGKQLFKTERGATNEIATLLDNLLWYEDEKYGEQAIEITMALAAKRGEDASVLYHELLTRAKKKHQGRVKKAYKEMMDPHSQWARYAADPANWADPVRKYAKENGLPPFDKEEK